MATQGRLRRRPALPDLPQQESSILTYLPQLDRAISDLYNDISELLQAHVALTDRASFSAVAVAVVVTFDSPLEDEQYQPLLTPSWNTTVWVTGIAAEGFTINVGTAAGGTGGTVYWGVVR